MAHMDILIMIICCSILLGFLVFIHEGGHYLASRAFGVRVSEFMLGFPGPSLSFKRGETRFGVTCVPLGGYAKVCGMEPGEMIPHLQPVLAAMYARGTANLEDIMEDCDLSEEDALFALDELVTFLVGTQEQGLAYMKACYAAQIVTTDQVVARLGA